MNKKELLNSIYLVQVGIVLILILIFITEIKSFKMQTETNTRVERIDSLLNQRNHLDSLYWNHIEKCAFELRDGYLADIDN